MRQRRWCACVTYKWRLSWGEKWAIWDIVHMHTHSHTHTLTHTHTHTYSHTHTVTHTDTHTHAHTHTNTKNLWAHYSLIGVQHNSHCSSIETCNDLINMHVTGQIYACLCEHAYHMHVTMYVCVNTHITCMLLCMFVWTRISHACYYACLCEHAYHMHVTMYVCVNTYITCMLLAFLAHGKTCYMHV